MRVVAFAVLAASLALGCDTPAPLASIDGGTDDAMGLTDVGPDTGMPFVTADHPPLPILANLGGARLRHPQLVIITYADDPNRATLEANAAWLVGSSWLTEVGAEYGVGAGSILANVERSDNAPASISSPDIEALITAGIADHTLPMAADGTFGDVLYVIYFPETTHITDPSLGASCIGYGGYHSEVATAAGRYAYAVVPSCPDFTPGLSALQFEQVAFSHEVIEAATDARPLTSPGWVLPRTGPLVSPWVLVGGEIADLCALYVGPHSFVRDSGWLATRAWSNAAASLNDRDPCIPAVPGSGAFYTVGVTPDSVQEVTPGSTVTFDVVAWTTGARSDFAVYAAPVGPATVTATISRSSMNNGDHATLTVNVPSSLTHNDYAIVYVEVAATSAEYHAEPVVVYVP